MSNTITITQILSELKTLYPNAQLVSDGNNVRITICNTLILVNSDSLYISPTFSTANLCIFFGEYDNINDIISKTVSAVNVIKDIVKVNQTYVMS